MGIPVVIKPSGGMPVTVSPYGTPMTEASNGFGIAVTQAPNGLPVAGITFGPTLALSAASVPESAAVNTTVGTLSLTPGTTGTPVYSLTDSAGGKFNISGALLRTNALLDFETASYHNVTVAVSGVTPAVANRQFTILVTDVLEPVIVLSLATVAETAAIGTTVGVLSLINSYTGTPAYTLVDNAGGRFAISGSNLNVAAALDYETATSHNITVSVSGVTPPALNKVFTIAVTDMPEPVIALTGTAVNEDAAVGVTVGTLSLLNSYTGTPVYTLTDSAGGKFAISGSNLNVAAALDYETAAMHSVTVAVSGITPAAANKVFTILVLDIVEVAGAGTWNPADKAALLTLSPDNLTAIGEGTSNNCSIRATVSQASGKRFCKFTLLETTSWAFNGGLQVGFLPASASIDPGYLGGSGGGGYTCHGTIFRFNGTQVTTTMPTWTTGDVISMALDLTAKKVWFRKNSDGWNGDILANQDPAAGIGGWDMTAAIDGTTPLFPACSIRSATVGLGEIRIDLTGSGAPTAYLPWGGGGVTGTTKNIVTDYGAVADGLWVEGTFTIYGGTTTLTCNSAAPFVSGDVGKSIVVSPMPFGSPLFSTIMSRVSGSVITLAHTPPANWDNANFPNPGGSMVNRPNVIVSWGTNNGKTLADGGVDGPFETFKKAYQGQTVTLTIPAGTYLISCGNFGGLFDGIRNITCNATGATLCGDSFQIQASAQYGGMGHSGYTASVSAGATSVTLLTPSDVSKFAIGDYAMMTGFDMQNLGYPTNQARHEYLLITAIDSDSGSPTYGKITFLTPLLYAYLSTWPLYTEENTLLNEHGVLTGNYSYGGPATLYAMDPKFNHTSVVNGLTIAQGNQYGVSGLNMTFNDCAFVGHGQLGPHMTMAKFIAFNNCDASDMNIEVDKLCHQVTSIGSSWLGLYLQSSSINELILDNTDVEFSVWAPRKLTIKNGCNIGSLSPNPATYGFADVLNVSNSAIGAFGSEIYHGNGFEIRNGDGSGTDGIEKDFTMTAGVISVPASMRWNKGLSQWAITGGRMHFVDANLGSIGLFTITDVTDIGTHIRVHTNWTQNGGTFPPSTYVGGLWLKSHNVTSCTFNAVSGCAEVQMLSLCTPHPLGSQYKRVFNGDVVDSGYWQLQGRIKYIKVEILGAYSGPTATVTLTLLFGNATVKMSDFSQVVWNPVINLKTGPRSVIFDTDADPYPTAWTGSVAGDTLTGMAEAQWACGNFRLLMTDIVGEPTPPTTRPTYIVTVVTDQGVA
jgi:hypothetical protein